jgi:hypothetical protein
LKSADCKLVEPIEVLRTEISAVESLPEQRSRFACGRSREIEEIGEDQRSVTAKPFGDVALGGIGRIANLIAEIEVTTGPSVFRSLPDFNVQFVHPLPRHEFFKTTRTAHALLSARLVPRNSLGILRFLVR